MNILAYKEAGRDGSRKSQRNIVDVFKGLYLLYTGVPSKVLKSVPTFYGHTSSQLHLSESEKKTVMVSYN